MEALPRRAYNRLLWRRAAAGMNWKVHLLALAAALIPPAIRQLISGRPVEVDWPVLAALALAALIVVEVVIFFFRRVAAAPHELYTEQLAKERAREAELADLKAQVSTAVPRPQLLLTYTVESLKGFEDEVSNPPIQLHNDGNAAAVEAQIDPLQLSPLITVTFTPVQRISSHETAVIAPRIEIRKENGGWELDHNDKHFGLAIQRAHVELAHRNVKTQHGSRRWPMVVRYHDGAGASYSQTYDLTLNVATMKAWTVFRT
jgi:hypothetical protein